MCDDILVANFKDFGSKENLTAAFGERWIYIGRKYADFEASPLGNPFKAGDYGGRGATLPYYRKWLWQKIQRGEEKGVKALLSVKKNSVLVCWCAPYPCHGNVVSNAVNWLKATRPKTAFISGHRDLTPAEFAQHYEPLIDKAIEKRHLFVVGDASGADSMAQKYLAQHISEDGITVYHAGMKARNLYGMFNIQGRYHSQTEKDKAMTAVSGYDIAWVRPGKEMSGTARNISRRRKW